MAGVLFASGDGAARFLPGSIHSRRIELVHIMNSRLGFRPLPEIARLPELGRC